MKPVVIFHHVPHELAGTLADALGAAGLRSEYVPLYGAAPPQPDLDRLAGLVVLGGPMNVDQTDEYPFLVPEVAWIRQATEARLPVLGVCLGAQLLAKALGAKVWQNPVKEIGWYPLELTPAAAVDPLFAGCLNAPGGGSPARAKTLQVFQWHGDTFDLPPGAVHLARSAACQHQAFRHGESAYGLQFHLEMTAEMIEDWLGNADNSRELAALDYIDPEAIRRQTPLELPTLQAVAARVFGQFATMCRRPSEKPG
jgi:GMP synthase (glutamine-hydrolysing)